MSFRRAHGTIKAFINAIVSSPIIQAAEICYKKFRKFRETHRKLKPPWSLKPEMTFYSHGREYAPTCPHTHKLIYMILKTNLRYLLMTKQVPMSFVIYLKHSIILVPLLYFSIS